MKFKSTLACVALIIAIGCAGFQRECTGCNAGAFGSDWVVAQYDMNMQPKAAWVLTNTSISNESSSDGIYWLDAESGHLVHISGWYNRVQVKNHQFKAAAKLVGIDLDYVQNGAYPALKPVEQKEE